MCANVNLVSFNVSLCTEFEVKGEWLYYYTSNSSFLYFVYKCQLFETLIFYVFHFLLNGLIFFNSTSGAFIFLKSHYCAVFITVCWFGFHADNCYIWWHICTKNNLLYYVIVDQKSYYLDHKSPTFLSDVHYNWKLSACDWRAQSSSVNLLPSENGFLEWYFDPWNTMKAPYCGHRLCCLTWPWQK